MAGRTRKAAAPKESAEKKTVLKFKADRPALAAAIEMAAKVAPNASGAPILLCTKLTLTGNELKIEAQDTDLQLTTSVEVTGKGDGSVAVPARPFADVLKGCSADTVECSVVRGRLRIASGGFAGDMLTQPEDEFPAPRAVEGESASYAAADFAATLRRVAIAASSDDSRPILTGVQLAVHDKGIELAATDSYRLAADVLEGQSVPDGMILPTKALGEVAAAIGSKKPEVVEVRFGEHAVEATVGDARFVIRKIEGEFPKWQSLWPESTPTIVSVPRSALAAAVSRVRQFARGEEQTPVRLVFGPESVTVMGGGQALGDAHEPIPCTVVGDTLDIGFNAAFLLDALRSVEADDVELGMTDGLKPATIGDSKHETYRHLLMPVKLAAHDKLIEDPEEEQPSEPVAAEEPQEAQAV
jgi:DNA polymerase-3 subunit beta